METLFNGFTLDTPPGTFPLSTDSMVLVDFVRLQKDSRVLDLGSGCATLGILLCAGDERCHVTGVEIDEAAHNAALDNIDRNALQHRVESVCADITDFAKTCAAGSFTNCVSNPPYFSGGPASLLNSAFRREETCGLSQLFAAAERALQWGGRFSLVHRPERLAELCFYAAAHNLQPKRLRFVRHHPSAPVSLVLVECKKGANPENTMEEICLFDENGQFTEDYRRIYHL